jgi:hypothetical protein
MVETKKLNLSEDWIIKRGWFLDLGELGDCIIEDGEIWGNEVDVNLTEYHFKDWVFSDCEMCMLIPWKDVPKIKTLDDAIALSDFDSWVIVPKPTTKILKEGDPKDLKSTEFEDLIKEVQDEKGKI